MDEQMMCELYYNDNFSVEFWQEYEEFMKKPVEEEEYLRAIKEFVEDDNNAQ